MRLKGKKGLLLFTNLFILLLFFAIPATGLNFFRRRDRPKPLRAPLNVPATLPAPESYRRPTRRIDVNRKRTTFSLTLPLTKIIIGVGFEVFKARVEENDASDDDRGNNRLEYARPNGRHEL